MLFSVIYSFECPPDAPVRLSYPPNWRKNGWKLTECHFSEFDESEGKPALERWKHRKVCALLSKKQFEEFIDDCNLFAEDVETMGSIGAPGFGWGWTPAISFRNDPYYPNDPDANAYVTPIPEMERKSGMDERDWQRVRKIIIEKYGF